MLKPMPTYRLDIHYKRTVTAYIEAEDESDIDDFLTENSDFDMLEDYPALVEGDETRLDEEGEEGDYDLTQVDGITAGWVITPGLELVERD